MTTKFGWVEAVKYMQEGKKVVLSTSKKFPMIANRDGDIVWEKNHETVSLDGDFLRSTFELFEKIKIKTKDINQTIATEIMGYDLSIEKKPNGNIFIFNLTTERKLLPEYSENINEAMNVMKRVVDQSKEKTGRNIDALEFSMNYMSHGEYYVEFFDDDDSSSHTSSSLAFSICIAALKLKGIEVE